MQATKRVLSFSAGAALSTAFFIRMDDMVYQNLRKKVVMPIQVLTNSQNITVDDLQEVGTGSKQFLMSFKPHALQKTSAKKLLVDDTDYSQP